MARTNSVTVRGFNASVGGKAGKPVDIIGQYGEGKKNTNGVEMLKFLKNNYMKTLGDRSLMPSAQWTWTRNARIREDAPDYIVVKHGSSKGVEVHI